MKTDVALLGASSYSYREIRGKVEDLVNLLGGAGNFVKHGESVLLKPNILTIAKPEQAVTTHPAVVKAVAELVLDAGGKPFIADSSATPGFKKAIRDAGLEAVAKELDIPIFALSDSIEYKQDSKKIYRILEISRHALEADRIINIPKLKAHAMMYVTMGVKNIFGCVVGRRKAQWHLKAGIDRLFFARMLVELYDAVSPALTVLDGVQGMEGDGPGPGGKPRDMGILAASRDAVAMDRVVLELLAGDKGLMYTNIAAAEMGVGETRLENINILGDSPESMKVRDFLFPKMMDVVPLPDALRRFVVNQLTPKPKEDRDKCTLCNQCIDICPTDVISSDGKKLAFNYDKCIRCFCCVEVCPEGAMKPHKPFLSRLVG